MSNLPFFVIKRWEKTQALFDENYNYFCKIETNASKVGNVISLNEIEFFSIKHNHIIDYFDIINGKNVYRFKARFK